jgi:glycosyltransferase involved in cell wall biosynthesis
MTTTGQRTTDVATGGHAGPQLSFVLPTFNEVGLLGSTVTNLVTGLDARDLSYEILIVENGSTDGTLPLARLLAAQIAGVRVLALPRGDYGGALFAGFGSARGQIVVNFDVDYYDLGFLDAALEIVEGDRADLVLASKRVPDADDRRPISRRLLTFGFTTMLRWAVALPVSDAHGMKVMVRARVEPSVTACRLRGSIYDVELLCRAHDAGVRISELPASVAERRPPRSSVVQRSFEALGSTARLAWILRRARRPRRDERAVGLPRGRRRRRGE